MFDFAPQEFHVLRARLAFVFVSQGEHFIGHIDTATGSQIEDHLSGVEMCQCGGVAAAEGCEHGLFRNLLALGGVVKVGGDRIATSADPWRGTATAASAILHAKGSLTVPLFHYLLDISGTHRALLFANLNDVLRFQRLVSCAALGIKELQ